MSHRGETNRIFELEQHMKDDQNVLASMGVESKENPFTMMTDRMKNGLSEIATQTKDRIQSFQINLFQDGHKYSAMPIAANGNDLVTKTKYSDVSVLKVPVPKGFVGDYLEYTNFLIDMLMAYSSLSESVLVPAIELVDVLVSHPDRLSMVTIEAQLQKFAPNRVEMQRYEKEIGNYFKQNGTDEFRGYGKVFKRNADFGEFVKRVKKLEQVYEARPTADILEKSRMLADSSDLLYTRIKNNEMGNLPNKAAVMIGEMLDTVAREVELFGTLCVMSEQLVVYGGNVYRHLQDRLDNDQEKAA